MSAAAPSGLPSHLLTLRPPDPQSARTAFLCLQTFQRFVSSSLKRSVWTAAEDEMLRELVEQMRIGNFIPYTQSNDIIITDRKAIEWSVTSW